MSHDDVAEQIAAAAVRHSRRGFLAASGVALSAALWAGLPQRGWAETGGPPPKRYPFTLGVASGDPRADAVVLWTRLAPEIFEPFGGMSAGRQSVSWQVATDAQFGSVVRAGEATAHREFSHSVHVDVHGLQPGREYFYRFRNGPHVSPVGRTRTAPAPDSRPDRFRFALACCQAYPDGYYTAHGHLAAEEDLDAVIFTGDYIYQNAINATGGDRRLTDELPEIFAETCETLDRYRLQYTLYKADPDLQAAHLGVPWILTWGDHEVDDNYADAFSKRQGVSVEDFLVRRANAYRAYWENVPLRRAQAPQGPDARLYRRFRWGTLTDLNVMDTRQYRSAEASGHEDSAERRDPNRSITGTQQERWLMHGLAASTTDWRLIAQEVLVSRLDYRLQNHSATPWYSMDSWDGYYASQQRIIRAARDSTPGNVVLLSGDVHNNYAMDVKEDFTDPDSATVASEIVGTSISSGHDGSNLPANHKLQLQSNPHMRFANGQRGYVRCDLTRERMQVDYRVVPYVSRRGAPISTRAGFVIESGRAGFQQVSGEPV